MKNSTILKDELGLLNADRSAVITELRRLSQELKEKEIEIQEAEKRLADVEKQKESEAKILELNKADLRNVTRELKNSRMEIGYLNDRLDSVRVKNSQVEKEHLGRVKEIHLKREQLLSEIDHAKALFDQNSRVLVGKLATKQAELKELEKKLRESEALASALDSEIKTFREEEKRLIRERLKREDKIRAREKVLDAKDKSLTKKEEDLETMASDMAIIYSRIKEYYAEVKPHIDLDKIITKGL